MSSGRKTYRRRPLSGCAYSTRLSHPDSRSVCWYNRTCRKVLASPLGYVTTKPPDEPKLDKEGVSEGRKCELLLALVICFCYASPCLSGQGGSSCRTPMQPSFPRTG